MFLSIDTSCSMPSLSKMASCICSRHKTPILPFGNLYTVMNVVKHLPLPEVGWHAIYNYRHTSGLGMYGTLLICDNQELRFSCFNTTYPSLASYLEPKVHFIFLIEG